MAASLLCVFLFVYLDGRINNTIILGTSVLTLFSTSPSPVHVSFLPDPQYSQPYRLLLNFVNSFRVRMRYYFIWMLAESINNCAGLGFSGYDKKGRPQWNLMSNLLIFDIEFGSNLRTCINGWNALTSLWLRR